MKAYLLTILLFFSCLSLVSAQKKYMVKVTTLDNKVYKGLMFQVRDKDFLILPNSAHFDYRVKENNIPRIKAFDFGMVKDIKIRKKGIVASGLVSSAIASDKSQDAVGRTLSAFFIGTAVLGGGTILGGVVGGTYSNEFDVKKDSTSIQSLKIELKKYEWYHIDKDTLNTK
jgi:hypothetical protein